MVGVDCGWISRQEDVYKPHGYLLIVAHAGLFEQCAAQIPELLGHNSVEGELAYLPNVRQLHHRLLPGP